ncbi:MAG TPA: 3-hydroxyacyl-ACP dehydratase FabZ family protein [Phycisphaerae bacterium]|nr:3-hydroxyacyl-ACP dehydratase FabZ family protein [Phycisphaerae bacterium]
MNESDFLGLIPHRRPFLFIDEVIELSADRIVTAVRADSQADFFTGHYPGNPLMPGVLICECAFQAGALLVAHRLDETARSTAMPVLTRIKEAKFRQIVRPGQTLNVEVVLDDELDGAYFMTGRVSVEGKPALRVEFACTLTAAGEGGS